MSRKTAISLFAGIALSAAALYLAFRNVPFRELMEYMATIDYLWLIPTTAIVLLSFMVRAWRWQLIVGSAQRIRFWPAYHPLMIGFMINCIMPGRVGEIARPVILQQRERVPFATGLATVAAERMFDVALLIVFFALVLAFVDIDPDIRMAFGNTTLSRETLVAIANGMFKLCVVLIAGIVMVSISRTRRIITAIIRGLPRLASPAGERAMEFTKKWIADPLVRIVENAAMGFAMVKQPGKLMACIGLSMLVWGMSAVSYYLMALGAPGITLGFLELSAVMIIVCFFIALPSVPGFWGIWEAGGVFALALFAIPAKEAAGFTLINHAVQMFPIIIAGLASAVITGIRIGQVTGEQAGT